MAIIMVRGRREPIVVKNEIAQKVKARWLGLGDTEKADPKDVVDLEVWAGEYGRITEIEMTAEQSSAKQVDNDAKIAEEQRLAEEAWSKMTVVQKSQHLGRFKLLYIKMNHWQKAPDDILKKAEKIQLDYYKKHPDARSLPNELYAPILRKIKVVEPPPVEGKCLRKECENPVVDSIYCSGKCQLAAQNG